MLMTLAEPAAASGFTRESSRTMPIDFNAQKLDTIDVHIGRRIRGRRRVLGLNQSELARRIGVTFQQVHKYETGQSSVTAARLYAIAVTLGVTFEYFYDELAV